MQLPTFRITRVDDGVRFGLPIERRDSPLAEPRRVYFHFQPGRAPGCLEVPGILQRKCTVYCLRPAEPTVLLFNELAEYAAAAHEAGDMRILMELTEIHPGNGYPTTASTALGKKQCPFALFFAAGRRKPYDVFKARVISSTRKTQELRGEGVLLRHCAPTEAFFFDDEFTHLQTGEQLLERHRALTPEWFRPRGPTFIDFESDYVCPRPLFSQLRNQLLSESRHIVNLVGFSGSGKSVAVRALAYDLMREGRIPVYYARPQFVSNAMDLVREINSVSGVVILEDAHLNPRSCQRICARSRLTNARRLLITARPRYLENPSDLFAHPSEYRCLHIDGASDADTIIAHFARHHPDMSLEAAHQIGSVKPDLWLVAHSLLGWRESHGRGCADDWVHDHVLSQLAALENPERGADCPRALLALSPLSMHEIPTASRFVTETCAIDRRALVELESTGLIQRATFDDDIYFTLPHASIARAYWEGLSH